MKKNSKILNDELATAALHQLTPMAVNLCTASVDGQNVTFFSRIVLGDRITAILTHDAHISQSETGADNIMLTERGILLEYRLKNDDPQAKWLYVQVEEDIKCEEDGHYLRACFKPKLIEFRIGGRDGREAKPNEKIVRHWRNEISECFDQRKFFVNNLFPGEGTLAQQNNTNAEEIEKTELDDVHIEIDRGRNNEDCAVESDSFQGTESTTITEGIIDASMGEELKEEISA